MAKIVCVLFPDAKSGHPSSYARDDIPTISHYSIDLTPPTPRAIDFKPGTMLGDVSGELGLRHFLERAGHELVVTSDKDGENSVFERELVDADVVISQPFWPAYLTAERIKKAKNLKLAITAGVGSDHVDLTTANEHKITVAEVTFSNSISVAEHSVMMILSLVRDYLYQHDIARHGGWDIADATARSYDVEGMQVGVIAAGRIGTAVLERMKPFNVGLHYFDFHRLPESVEKELKLTYHTSAEALAAACDIVSIHTPLTPVTDQMFNAKFFASMKRGSYVVNCARGKLIDANALVDALKSGQLAGYAGDVWYPQPAPADHPWRTMPHNGMTPHTSGASLSAQTRYAAGTREILECFFAGKPIRDEYLIIEGGKFAGRGAHSYTPRAKA